MGQNNDPTEHGDPQGQQGGKVTIPAAERKREAGYPRPKDSQEGQHEDVPPRS